MNFMLSNIKLLLTTGVYVSAEQDWKKAWSPLQISIQLFKKVC